MRNVYGLKNCKHVKAWALRKFIFRPTHRHADIYIPDGVESWWRWKATVLFDNSRRHDSIKYVIGFFSNYDRGKRLLTYTISSTGAVCSLAVCNSNHMAWFQ